MGAGGAKGELAFLDDDVAPITVDVENPIYLSRAWPCKTMGHFSLHRGSKLTCHKSKSLR